MRTLTFTGSALELKLLLLKRHKISLKVEYYYITVVLKITIKFAEIHLGSSNKQRKIND